MARSVALWFFLLCLILWLVLTMVFGWMVKSQLSGSDRTGAVGRAAVQVASFPTLVKDVFKELNQIATGRAAEISVTVEREVGADYSGFVPLDRDDDSNVEGLLYRAESTRMARGWRYVLGGYSMSGTPENGLLLLSPDLKIVRALKLDEISVGGVEPAPNSRKFVHGFDLLPDGSFIVAFDEGMSLQRFDSCGKRLWTTVGEFHHTVSLSSDANTVWSLINDKGLAEVSVADGTVLRQISMEDVVAANPEVDILQMRRKLANGTERNDRNTAGKWMEDPLHMNEVEPLPANLAAAFPDFSVGDLLISARSLNLVFVLDPSTLKIKWWRIGLTERQHDPDWLPSGEIMVYNNRMGRDFSEIVTLDASRNDRRVIFDGRKNDFFSRIRGKVQPLPDGSLAVTSPQQGRAFEVSRDGQVAFELVNPKPGDDKFNYVVSELKWVPETFFSGGLPDCGSGGQ